MRCRLQVLPPPPDGLRHHHPSTCSQSPATPSPAASPGPAGWFVGHHLPHIPLRILAVPVVSLVLLHCRPPLIGDQPPRAAPVALDLQWQGARGRGSGVTKVGLIGDLQEFAPLKERLGAQCHAGPLPATGGDAQASIMSVAYEIQSVPCILGFKAALHAHSQAMAGTDSNKANYYLNPSFKSIRLPRKQCYKCMRWASAQHAGEGEGEAGYAD
jgi:hypothetical protein